MSIEVQKKSKYILKIISFLKYANNIFGENVRSL